MIQFNKGRNRSRNNSISQLEDLDFWCTCLQSYTWLKVSIVGTNLLNHNKFEMKQTFVVLSVQTNSVELVFPFGVKPPVSNNEKVCISNCVQPKNSRAQIINAISTYKSFHSRKFCIIFILLHFVAFFHAASLFSTGVDNEKVGVDNEKALELTNSTVFHRGRQQKSSRADKQHCFPQGQTMKKLQSWKTEQFFHISA